MNGYGMLILGFIVVFSLLDFWIEYIHIRKLKEPISKEVEPVYSAIVYDRYKKNERKRFLFSNIKTFVRLMMFVIFSIFGLFTQLDQLLSNTLSNDVIKHSVFVGLYFLMIFLSDVVVDLIDDFGHKQSRMTKRKMKRFSLNVWKRLLMMFGLGGLAVFFLLLLYQLMGTMFFILLFVLVESVIIIFSLFFTSIIVPIFYKLKPLEEGELKEQIQIFLRQEGYQIDDVYVLNQGRKSSNMNAFVSGFSTRKRIVLFDTLLKKLTNDEIVAVIAHELGHQKKGHLLFNLGLSTLLVGGFTLGLYLFLTSEIFPTSFGFSDSHLGFSMILYIYFLDVYLLLARLILSVNSRKFEYQADHYAKDVWYKDSLSSALIKISKKNIEHLTPHPLYAMIYFTHPSLGERLKQLLKEEHNE